MSTPSTSDSQAKWESFDATKIERPAPQLLTYYILVSLIALPVIWIVLPISWFRYITLRYTFDEEGISMRWGIIFHREVVLTYRRIQDIHVTRDLLQRWLGLATVSVQTASGSATPEMRLEGILEAEALRDYLYLKMRGSRQEQAPGYLPAGSASAGTSTLVGAEAASAGAGEVTQLLAEIRDNLQRMAERQGGRS